MNSPRSHAEKRNIHALKIASISIDGSSGLFEAYGSSAVPADNLTIAHNKAQQYPPRYLHIYGGPYRSIRRPVRRSPKRSQRPATVWSAIAMKVHPITQKARRTDFKLAQRRRRGRGNIYLLMLIPPYRRLKHGRENPATQKPPCP